MRRNEPEVWKGVLAGAAAGLAASWIMLQFQNGWSNAQKKLKEQRGEQQEPQSGEHEDATMKSAGAIARRLFHRELTYEEKKRFGSALHYGFGTLLGAVYGGLSEQFPHASLGWGSGFGSAVFLGADEMAVPMLHLAPSPRETPLGSHLYAWASHLVYGMALESVRKPARFALGYDDPYLRNRRAAREAYERITEFADDTKRRSKKQWKSGLKSAEKAFRRMRKAA